MKKIYIADDEENIRNLLKMFLTKEGFSVEAFSDGEALLQAFMQQPADMVILDIMMPRMDGFSVCSSLRRKSNVPIIMVSARDTEADRITGITLGSDDYLVKPFSPSELVVRVKSLFRRIEMDRKVLDQGNDMTMGNLTVLPHQKCALVDGVNLDLTLTELSFLLYLIQNRERAVSREELLNQVWGYQSEVETRATDDTVKRLRRKLAMRECTVEIETVWGFGFKLKMKESPAPPSSTENRMNFSRKKKGKQT